MTGATDQRQSRRARARLATLGVAVLGVAAVFVALVVDHVRTDPAPAAPVSQPRATVSPGPDVAAEAALAARPMLWLPADVAQPHTLADSQQKTPIPLPTPSTRDRQWIPTSFPATSEGALAQLAALDQAGVSGGDPSTYARAYSSLAEPGAPPVSGSTWDAVLGGFRHAAGLAPGDVKLGLTVRYEVTQGLVKGVAAGGRYVVVCVLGEFSSDAHGYGSTLGIGDCQAMRWTSGGWRISAGPRAAYASSAWPGTIEAAEAGYHPLSGVAP